MSTITEYFESLRGQSIAIIGMGVSNTPLIRMMLRAGLKVTVCDKASRDRIGEQADELESLGAKFQLGEDYLHKLYKFDVIFRTPGLSPNNPALLEAAQRGSRITSEMELFFALCPCRMIAVTGSDGKTTTTTLISEFLKEALHHVMADMPYRGPKIFTKGDYHYHCKVEGEFVWFQGYEEIFYLDEKIYECYFHGGVIR